MKCIEPEMSPDELNISDSYVTHEATTAQCDLDVNLDEIATTSTVPGTIRTAVGRKIWSKIPGKTYVKKLINKFGCLKHCALFNRKPVQFHWSYTGVSADV